MYNFRVAHNNISSIVRDVCQAIKEEYAGEVIVAPTTQAEWLQIAELFLLGRISTTVWVPWTVNT